MDLMRQLLLGTALLTAIAASAAEPVVILHDDAARSGKSGDKIFDIRQNAGSRCEATAVGSCGSCAVSCPVGEAATCRPGKAVGKTADASCVTEPSCTCK